MNENEQDGAGESAGAAVDQNTGAQEAESQFNDGFNMELEPDKDGGGKIKGEKNAEKVNEKTDQKDNEEDDNKEDDNKSEKDDTSDDDLEKRAEKGGFVERERNEKGQFVASKKEGEAGGDESGGEQKPSEPRKPPVVLDPLLAEYLDDEPISINNKEIYLKEFVSEFPEVAAVARKIAEGIASKMVKDSNLVQREEFTKTVNYLSERAFWGDVSEEIQSARKTYESKEFKDWLGKQSPGIKRMAAETGNAEDMIHILKSFKDSKKSNTRKADLMSGNLQGQRKESSNTDAMSEFAKGFNTF